MTTPDQRAGSPDAGLAIMASVGALIDNGGSVDVCDAIYVAIEAAVTCLVAERDEAVRKATDMEAAIDEAIEDIWRLGGFVSANTDALLRRVVDTPDDEPPQETPA